MSNRYLNITFVLALAIFIGTTYMTQAKGYFPFDESFFEWMQNMSSSVSLEVVMEWFSMIGSSEVILLITAVIAGIFLLQRNWLYLIFFLIVSVGGVFLNLILKLIIQRERPDGEISYIDVFNFTLEIPSYSFPSGHTMRSTILFLFLIFIILRFVFNRLPKQFLVTICILSIVGVAFSRAFLEAHFLSDIIAAISISLAWFILCLIIFNKYDRRNRLFYRKMFL